MAAAIRLVGDQTDDPSAAAERFLESAERVGIDPANIWVTIGPDGRGGWLVRETVLAVQGTGRTAMVYISGPARRRRSGDGVDRRVTAPAATEERAALLLEACRAVATGEDDGITACLAQALLEPREVEPLKAYMLAGFTRVGDLAYLRKVGAPPAPVALPEGARMASVAELSAGGLTGAQIDHLIGGVLDRTYIDTLDCPELCGLRTAADVLESHRSVGRYDPSLWWVVFMNEAAVGCALFNLLPESESAELVYLGLAPEARGKGLGAATLAAALRYMAGYSMDGRDTARGRVLVGTGGVTCAVDTRNEAALRLYRAAGFKQFALRVPVVKGLAGAAA
jgi:ribosomal protein S18 acetylase RimI-like enzyme